MAGLLGDGLTWGDMRLPGIPDQIAAQLAAARAQKTADMVYAASGPISANKRADIWANMPSNDSDLETYKSLSGLRNQMLAGDNTKANTEHTRSQMALEAQKLEQQKAMQAQQRELVRSLMGGGSLAAGATGGAAPNVGPNVATAAGIPPVGGAGAAPAGAPGVGPAPGGEAGAPAPSPAAVQAANAAIAAAPSTGNSTIDAMRARIMRDPVNIAILASYAGTDKFNDKLAEMLKGTETEMKLRAAGVKEGSPEWQMATRREAGVENAPSAGDLTARAKAIQTATSTLSAIDQYEKIATQLNTTDKFLPTQRRIEHDAARANLLILMKEAANLGALTGPDVGIVNEMMGDPTKFWANPQKVTAALNIARKTIQNNLAASAAGIASLSGSIANQPGAGGQGAPTSGVLRYNPPKPKGE